VQQKALQAIQKQPSQHYLTLLQRHSIITLLAFGQNVKEISLFLKRDMRTIKRWINSAFNSVDVNLDMKDQHRTGRPSVLNEEEKTLIVARAAEDHFVTPSMIKIELDLNCSSRTIDRVLIEANLNGRIAMKSYPYTDTQKQIRLLFANNMLSKTNSFWDNVLFTDESSLQLGLHHNKVYVRRPRGDQYKFMDEYVWKDESKKHSGTLKFFGSFSSHGIGKLYFYKKMTGKEMIKIIKKAIIPDARRLLSAGPWYILHDNDKRWKNNEVVSFIHNKGITQINDSIWPSYSPDLNPIENLWADLSARVFDRNPCGVDELKEFIEEEWKNTDMQLLQHLAYSMSKRCQLVSDAQGGRIKY